MPRPGETQTINGRTMSWQPTTRARDAFNYQGEGSGYASLEDAQAADEAGDDGSWVPSSFGNPNGTLFGPSWMLPAMIGGPAAAAGLGALFGVGGAAAAGGSTAAAGEAALPVSAGLPASLGVGGSTSVGGFGTAAAAAPAAATGSGALNMMAGGNPYVNLATNVGTGMMNAYSQGKQSDKMLAEQQRQFNASQAQNQQQFEANQQQGQANQALNAGQMNPVSPAASRQAMALMNMLMRNYSPVNYSNGQFSGGFSGLTPEMMQGISQYSSPDAMSAQEAAFNANAGAASGGQFQAPSYAGAGYQPMDRKVPEGLILPGMDVAPTVPPANATGVPGSVSTPAEDTNLNTLIARLTGRRNA